MLERTPWGKNCAREGGKPQEMGREQKGSSRKLERARKAPPVLESYLKAQRGRSLLCKCYFGFIPNQQFPTLLLVPCTFFS